MKAAIMLFLAAGLVASTAASENNARLSIDAPTVKKVDQIIQTTVLPGAGYSHGALVSQVSTAFLGVRYQAHTLIGSADTPEVLVARFNGVDCFTLIDYVEALTHAKDYRTFVQHLARVRYVKGQVAYQTRRYFFTDWAVLEPANAVDVTREISPHYQTVEKWLNQKPGASGEYLRGVGVIHRVIDYIPGQNIDGAVLRQLRDGDYVGVYSPLAGLDVTHVGIVIKQGGQVWFRNASSLRHNMKVVDSPFLDYMMKKPGIIVLRAG